MTGTQEMLSRRWYRPSVGQPLFPVGPLPAGDSLDCSSVLLTMALLTIATPRMEPATAKATGD